VEEPEIPWWQGPDSVGTEPFTFVVISDPHIRLPGNPDDGTYNAQKNIDNLTAAVDTINNELGSAKFVAVTGDLVGALFSSDPADYPDDANTPAHQFRGIMQNLSMPWEVVLGNHDYQEDYTNEGITADVPEDIEAVWSRVLGIPPYYSLTFRGWRFLFLNSTRGDRYWDLCILRSVEASCTGSFDDTQIAWIEQELQNPEPVILFFHHPLHTDSWYTLWSAAGSSFKVHEDDAFYGLAEAYADKIKAIFVGHGHLWASDTLHDTILVHETNAMGDGMGNPDNINIVEVNPAEGTFSVSRF
jgi:3',5'-cyclic AMP phosphodiesterase CpdA